ncbi:hypothetical protein SL1157_0506 [Ruegeria lacuscaerulensis ITI-1157]|nr:hypothetical protein SL1157_0506 [Ruegeria lacuscaerulensis ITI-1157]
MFQRPGLHRAVRPDLVCSCLACSSRRGGGWKRIWYLCRGLGGNVRFGLLPGCTEGTIGRSGHDPFVRIGKVGHKLLGGRPGRDGLGRSRERWCGALRLRGSRHQRRRVAYARRER